VCSCVSVVKRPEIASPDAGSLCHGGPAHGAHGLLNGHHGLYDAGHERNTPGRRRHQIYTVRQHDQHLGGGGAAVLYERILVETARGLGCVFLPVRPGLQGPDRVSAIPHLQMGQEAYQRQLMPWETG